MCFSATASFVAAGLTGAAGVATLSRVPRSSAIPLATIPLFFSAQQAIEGALWLTLPVSPDGPAASHLTLMFIVIAKIFWPVYAPMAVLLVERDATRRKILMALCAVGCAVALFFLDSALVNPHGAHVLGGHIVYSAEPTMPRLVGLAYLAATGIAPMFSSHRPVQLLGLIVTAGSLITYFFYWEAFVSVWCFFAAAGSVVILAHFERVRRSTAVAV